MDINIIVNNINNCDFFIQQSILVNYDIIENDRSIEAKEIIDKCKLVYMKDYIIRFYYSNTGGCYREFMFNSYAFLKCLLNSNINNKYKNIFLHYIKNSI